MKLFAFGDSWTEGQGVDSEMELTLKDRDDLRKFRNELSWVKLLSDKLKCECVNKGLSGNSNQKIFNDIVKNIQENIITNDDLVIVTWSSSLRDSVPFLPNNEWLSWSIKQLLETSSDRFIKSYKSGDNRYDSFLQSYKEFYIGELFNQNYYNIINQNYIIFIQKMMEHYGIKYIMCDAFENMLIDVKPKDDVTKYINKKVYWGFGKKCFKQLLYEQKEMDIWEKIETSKQDIGGIHPNKKGYQIIYNEVYEFLKKLNYV
jgi:hypothetical protein